MVSNVRVTSVKSTEISLAWDAPSDPYSDIEMYEVRHMESQFIVRIMKLIVKKEIAAAFIEVHNHLLYIFREFYSNIQCF